jgi:hypothetical protein
MAEEFAQVGLGLPGSYRHSPYSSGRDINGSHPGPGYSDWDDPHLRPSIRRSRCVVRVTEEPPSARRLRTRHLRRGGTAGQLQTQEATTARAYSRSQCTSGRSLDSGGKGEVAPACRAS